MPIQTGADRRITGVKRGLVTIGEIRQGTILRYRSATMRDTFSEDRGIGLGPNWSDHGPATSPNLISVENESYARMQLADGVNVISTKTSKMRWNAGIATSDDGYLELRPATRGDWEGDFETVAYSHLSDGAFTHGVGISLRGSRLRIRSMTAGVLSDRADGGSFQAGDIIRLVHTNGGSLHTLFRNGRQVAVWNDAGGLANKGAGYRSYGISMIGRKDSIFTGRRYSPGLDYIEAGGGDARIRSVASHRPQLYNKRTPTFSSDPAR